jgi:hypothetical protein
MKPMIARFLLPQALLCLALGACTAPPSDPPGRFAWMKSDMSREELEKYYGPPTLWVLYYEPAGFTVFSYDKLLSYSTFDEPRRKPDWPLQEGMSVRQVEKILGNPSKACAGEYYTESYAHWFCYKNDRLISKERKLTPFS